MASSNSANKLMKEMQKIASDAQVKVQKLANEATEKSFKYNKEEANTARQWQTEMSNTAHQREVADLKKAGLNPVLSANSGAQSYTTSAASAQANDPSGSIGSLAGDLIQSRTSAYQADTSAAATRQAAKQTAAATRYAAMQSAQAQKYAAAMSYQNQREHEKWQTQYMKDEYKEKINYANSIPASNAVQFFDKLAQKFGVYDSAKKQLNSQAKKLANAQNNPNFRINTDKAFTYSNINASMKRDRLDPILKQLGVSRNEQNRRILFNATFTKNKAATNAVTNWYKNKYYVAPRSNSSADKSLNRYYEHH